MSSTTRSETALIRPFTRIENAEKPLEGVRLRVAEENYEAGAVVLAEDVLSSASLYLSLPEPQVARDAIAKTVVPAVDCGLVVIASARSHRISRVLLREYLKPGSWETDFVLDRDAQDLVLSDRLGFTLTVAIVLLHDLTPEPLRPNMAGTWLARREFKVSPERQDTSFSPEELTDEIRIHHGLPGDSLRFVYVGDWEDAEELSDETHVYLDAEVLNLLLANPNDALAVQLQIELAIQATETVALTIARDLAVNGNEPSANSLDSYPAAQRFFGNLAASLELEVADVLSLAAAEPARLRACLESAFKMRGATTSALKER